MHQFKSGWAVGAGYAQFWSWSQNLAVPEYRPEQWIFYKQTFEKARSVSLNHRYKMEERFIQDSKDGKLLKGTTFTMRFRYRLGFDWTIGSVGKNKIPFKFLVSDEIMLNAGKTIVYNVFDQNRLMAGLSVKPLKSLTISAHYMNIYRQQRTGHRYDLMHAFRLMIEHEFTYKQKEKHS